MAADLGRRLGPGAVRTDPATRRLASRDHSWLSPILTEDLPDTPADLVVRPVDTAGVVAALDAAARHRVPVTPRGKGTGNYGQAVPLHGGAVLDLAGCERIVDIAPDARGGGVAHVGAGVTFRRLEAAAAPHGLEVAVMPSTTNSTVGGFLSGGNQGVGSIEHGSIWDGTTLATRVVPCAAGPEPFWVEGPDALTAHLHTYGTAGVLAEVRVRLAPLRARTAVYATFAHFADATAAGRTLMDLDPPPRAVAVDDPAIVAALPPNPGLSPDRVVLRLAVTPDTVERVRRTVADHGGDVTAVDDEALPALVTSVYNHALLRARRLDPAVCSLQVRGPAIVEREDAVRAALPETRLHLDGNAPRRHGKGWSGLLLSRWVDRPTLQRGIDDLRALGVQVISPHTCVLGGHGDDGRLDAIRAAAARIDRHGLLNPGKLPPAPVPEAAA